eukprot:gnl/Carplike_NY0171/9760_a13668_181.p1 GENE.gnl/Carplike_NY0171/9760_a13668_181~~gnl/Carplike_NY0171/9760_a13668_181.p1  ORF type:complete len:141 (-),score=16.95 gnl/Carplike_NY0171/9760_a13668_181:129-551(-)
MIVDPLFLMVKGKDDSYCKESECYDQSSEAQKMLKGEGFVSVSHLSIPFPSFCSLKGAYIGIFESSSSPSLLFTFTDSDGTKSLKKYKFSQPIYGPEWYYLPIDLPNVVLCEIIGKGSWNGKHNRDFCINSLVFVRNEDV